MNPGPTFDRVYASLKQQLLGGFFPAGQHLEAAALGEDLHASITPVRDALHRLAGERLVESPRHDGFRVPLLTEADLRDLYGWNGVLVDWALRGPRGARLAADLAGAAAPHDAAALFLALAQMASNAEHALAIAGLNDRMAPFRHIEPRIFADFAEEFEALSDSIVRGDQRTARRRLAAYHRRRQRAAPEILVQPRRRAYRY